MGGIGCHVQVVLLFFHLCIFIRCQAYVAWKKKKDEFARQKRREDKEQARENARAEEEEVEQDRLSANKVRDGILSFKHCFTALLFIQATYQPILLIKQKCLNIDLLHYDSQSDFLRSSRDFLSRVIGVA